MSNDELNGKEVLKKDVLTKQQSEKLRYHMEHINDIFPDRILTLIARNPLQIPGADDYILTWDNIHKLIASLEWSRDVAMEAHLAKFREKH